MFVVDGYNAIRRIPRLKAAEEKGGLASGRRALVAAIVASGILRVDRGLVVFDGGSGAPGNEPTPHRMLAIRFSNHPETADEAILALLEGARVKGALESVSLVTADRDLSFRAAALGASVVSPNAWTPLSSPRRRPKRGRSTSSEKPPASAADVRYWLSVFGSSED